MPEVLRSEPRGWEPRGTDGGAWVSSCRKQDLVWQGGRKFSADGGLRCQSEPEAGEAEIAQDAGRRRLVGLPQEEILSLVRGLGGQVLQPEV